MSDDDERYKKKLTKSDMCEFLNEIKIYSRLH
jgi:hypothetical protein